MVQKKKMRVSMDPAPSTSFLTGEGPSARLKHQILFQDYQDLLKDTEEKKERLNKALHSRLKLLAEVKFLIKKFHSFTRIPRPKPSRVKKPSNRQVAQPSPSVIETSSRNHKSKNASAQGAPKVEDLSQFKVPLSRKMTVQSAPKVEDLSQFKEPMKERNNKSRGVSGQCVPKLLDLNQVSLPNGDEAEFQVNWEPLKMVNLKRSFVEGNALADDIKLSVCRDIGSGGGQAGWGAGNFHGKIPLKF